MNIIPRWYLRTTFKPFQIHRSPFVLFEQHCTALEFRPGKGIHLSYKQSNQWLFIRKTSLTDGPHVPQIQAVWVSLSCPDVNVFQYYATQSWRWWTKHTCILCLRRLAPKYLPRIARICARCLLLQFTTNHRCQSVPGGQRSWSTLEIAMPIHSVNQMSPCFFIKFILNLMISLQYARDSKDLVYCIVK